MGLVFLTVIITVFLSGSLSKKIAEMLEVIPMEILIIGGGKVGRILAERFDRRGENAVVVDISGSNCKKCMDLGIRTIQGDAGDVNVLKKQESRMPNMWLQQPIKMTQTFSSARLLKLLSDSEASSWWPG